MSTTWQDVIEARRATDEAQARLDAVRRETAPKIAEIRARREKLRQQRGFCMLMAMVSVVAPMVIGALIALAQVGY